jgi:hypothetical protein
MGRKGSPGPKKPVLALSDQTSAPPVNQTSGGAQPAAGEEKGRIMRKLQMAGLTLIAIFAFGAVTAASASAETTLLAEWLINAAAVVTLTSVEIIDVFLIEDLSTGDKIICGLVDVGSIGPSGEIEITEVLTLTGVAVTLAAPGLCEANKGCEASTTDVEIAPDKEPWHGLMFLKEDGSFLLDELSNSAYTVSCLVLGVKITDECSYENGSVEVLNVTGGVEVKKEEEVLPDGTCSVGGANELTIVYLGTIIIPLTGSLTVSSI